MLLAFDDLHWADADSLALISFICRRSATLPVGVIAALRSWPPETREMVRVLSKEAWITVEPLQALSESATAALLSSRIGRPVEDRTTRAAWRLCSGNPLLLEHIAPSIARGETLEHRAWPEGSEFSEQLVLQNFADLPAPVLQYAQAASVIGTRFRPDIVAQVAQLADRTADAALDALNRSGLLQETEPGRMEFVHPLFCQALYRGLGAGTRLRLHTRAFKILAARGFESEAAVHARNAYLAGDQEAIGILERVGQIALRMGALASAASHLQTAVELAGDLAGAELLLELGEALLASGRPAEAAPVYERILARQSVPGVIRSKAMRMLGRALSATGLPERAAAQFEAAATLAEGEDPRLAAEALLDQALAAWVALGPSRALPLTIRARELARLADNATRRRAVTAHALIALETGDASGLDQSAEAARVVARDPMTSLNDLCWTWGVLQTHSVAAVYAERFSEAKELLDVADAAAERLGAAEALASVAVAQAGRLSRIGNLQDALQQIRRANDLASVVPFVEATAAAFRADILLELGHVEQSEWWCARAEAAAHVGRQSMPLILVAQVRASLCIAKGMLLEACALYESIEQLTQNLGIGNPCTFLWARSAISAFLAASRTDDAVRVLDWVQQCSQRLPCHWPRIVVETSNAMLAEKRGHLDAAARHYEMAFALHNVVSLPLEHLRTLSDFGFFLQRTGKSAQARQVLSEGLLRADKIGAAQFAARFRAELHTWHQP
jgi:tetratricopeptide (TPR) repeat protein